MTDDLTELENLRAENCILRESLARLETQVSFLSTHRTLAQGMMGERLIAKALLGSVTPHTASIDIRLPDGQTIEVKKATISYGNPARKSGARWQWQKIFGEQNRKDFDWLLLVGDADPRYSQYYLDPSSPFVVFCVPFAEVEALTTAGTRGARGVLLSTNPLRTHSAASVLYTRYQVVMNQLELRIGGPLRSSLGA